MDELACELIVESHIVIITGQSRSHPFNLFKS
jgi:hypothetical protein